MARRKFPGVKGKRPDRKERKRAEAIARGAPIHPKKSITPPFIRESSKDAKDLDDLDVYPAS